MNNNFMMNNMYSKPMPVSAGKVYPADQPMVKSHIFNVHMQSSKSNLYC